MKAFYTLLNFTKGQVNQASKSLLKETEVKTYKEKYTSLCGLGSKRVPGTLHQETLTEHRAVSQDWGWGVGLHSTPFPSPPYPSKYCPPHYRMMWTDGSRGAWRHPSITEG